MQNSMFSAMFGAMAQEMRLRTITNNLANVNTTGYKKDNLAFKDTFIRFAHDTIYEPVANLRSDKLFPRPMQVARPRLALALTNFSQGSMRSTGGPLDMAIAGDGFFKIRTPDGDYYSRNGHFQVTPEGVLVTEQGWPVLGQGGEIALPPNAHVTVDGEGRILADGAEVDQFQVVTVDNLALLEKRGESLYQGRNNQPLNEVDATGATVNQGFLEASNVNVVEEMVNMIEAQRTFEAYTKMITNTQETDLKAVTQVGRVK
ncbi:MAG: flagellar basal-body rod protein FlgF [Desulfovibrionaceae bacterium]|jgi:flagellar basal-body rod protein FlgG|nr:flagellar basal-body rod protein FlgF [Desulfovibrionaceae bacterium]